MAPGPALSVTVSLHLVTFSCDPDDPGADAWARCIPCGGRLRLHQPDPQEPGAMLGVCAACGRWHAVRLGRGWASGVLACLPPLGRARDVHADPIGTDARGDACGP